MDELRIPVMSKEAVIEFIDGTQSAGFVFVPTAAPDHTGPMRLVEWLNVPEAFFPFKAHGNEETPSLVNKQNIVSLTAYHDRDANEHDELDNALKLNVRVDTPRGSVTGNMIVDMPDNKLRALDVLNSEKGFVFLFDCGKEIHINKKFIIKATEI